MQMKIEIVNLQKINLQGGTAMLKKIWKAWVEVVKLTHGL